MSGVRLSAGAPVKSLDTQYVFGAFLILNFVARDEAASLLYPVNKGIAIVKTAMLFIKSSGRLDMNLFHKLLHRNKRKKATRSPVVIPPWEEIVEIMHDKNLQFSDEVVQVLYSRDNSKRYIILKGNKGYGDFYKYSLEQIYLFDEEELNLMASNGDTLPAYWSTVGGFDSSSFFGTIKEALTELHSEPVFKTFFETLKE